MIKKITIAIDAMGGDDAPDKTIQGVSLFLKNNKQNTDFFINLFGDEKKIKDKLLKYNIRSDAIKVIHTSSVVSDEETPLTAVKNSKNTSMWNCIKSQIDGDSDISLSAGNTGVLLVISRMILKMMDDVSKPALAGLWPNNKGMNVVLDLGANIECDDNNLVDFAELGSALYKSLFTNEKPKVSLLNVGSEEIKGTETLKKTFKKLSNLSGENNFLFKGYIEGNQIMSGDSNVIITDGFTGNVVLKEAEAFYSLIAKRGLLDDYFSRFNYENYGGTPVLGVNGNVLIGHGISNAKAIKNMLNLSLNLAQADLPNKIKKAFK